MASIGKDRNGRKRILFVAEDGSRKTIRLGKSTLKQAEAFKVKLDALVAGRITSNIDDETARWVTDLPEDFYGKLAAAGLLKPRANLNLGQFLKRYIDGRCDVKPSTKLVYKRTQKHLIEFFGHEKPLRRRRRPMALEPDQSGPGRKHHSPHMRNRPPILHGCPPPETRPEQPL